MGRPSDRRRSARRLGKRERARRKKAHRGELWAHVGGAGTYHVKAGRKKHRTVAAYCDRVMRSHLAGDSRLKSGTVIKRPLYTITVY